ncbi:MAG: hypothetical protein EPN39_15875 [Chitinophagaceae bacterium]|nr:MAG: hypothetical protein EPN39_15875 [Chitinophagaceae bacterium]
MACDLTIYLKNGRQLHVDKKDYEGFFTRPASRETVICKFKTLCNPFVDEKKSDKIIATVKDLKKHNITELMETLRTLK